MIYIILDDFDAQDTFTDDPSNTLASQFAGFLSNNLVLRPVSATTSHSDTVMSNIVDMSGYLCLKSLKLNTIKCSSLIFTNHISNAQ